MFLKTTSIISLVTLSFLLTACESTDYEPTEADIHNTIKADMVHSNELERNYAESHNTKAHYLKLVSSKKTSCRVSKNHETYICEADITVVDANGNHIPQHTYLRFDVSKKYWGGKVLPKNAIEVSGCSQTCSISE